MSQVNVPRAKSDLDQMIRERASEGQRLEFKRGAVLVGDRAGRTVTKAISGMANADGGVIIFGIACVSNRAESIAPVEVKDCTIDHLEQLVNLLRPRLHGLETLEIRVDELHAVFVLVVPASQGTPYQASDFVHYRRAQSHCLPMEHFEIEDLRRRASASGALVAADLRVRSVLVDLVITNRGGAEATNIRVVVVPDASWDHGRPRCLERPIRRLRPAQEFAYLYGSILQILSRQGPRSTEVEIQLSYADELTQSERTSSFFFDLEDYRGALDIPDDFERLGGIVKDGFRRVSDELKKIDDRLESLGNLSSPTGLDLSVTTRRSLARTLDRTATIERFPATTDYSVLGEVLEVDQRTAFRLQQFFRHERSQGKTLANVEGMTPELEAKIRERLADVD